MNMIEADAVTSVNSDEYEDGESGEEEMEEHQDSGDTPRDSDEYSGNDDESPDQRDQQSL